MGKRAALQIITLKGVLRYEAGRSASAPKGVVSQKKGFSQTSDIK